MARSPSPIKQDDLVYLITRAVSILAGLGWLTLNPVSQRVILLLYALFIMIIFYSLLIYFYCFFYKKQKLKQVYIFLLPFDVVALSLITILTGGPASPFLYGLYLLVILPAFYYGLAAGLASAFIIFLIDIGISLYFFPGLTELIEHSVFRLGFYWVIAIAGGLLADKYLEEEKALQKTSQSLNDKLSILNLLFDISHSLLFELELAHRKQAFAEVLKKVFHLSSFAVFFLNNSDRKTFFRFSYNPNKINFSLVLKALKEKETFLEFQKKYSQRKPFYQDSLTFFPLMVKEDTTAYLVCLKADLNKLSKDEMESLALFASLAGISFHNALLHQQIKESSITDDLTGLYNHRLLKTQLERELKLAQRYGKFFSVILLDLDNFKDYNDNFGHLEGDEALRKIGDILKKNTRTSDFPSRYGGDEFAVICPNTTLEEAVFVASKLQETVSNFHFRGAGKDKHFKITMSAGVSVFPTHANNIKDLLRAADNALFKAKAKGGNKLEIATPVQ